MADNNRKTIQFNTALFAIPNNNSTRKSRKPTGTGLKIKTPSARKREDTLKHNSILRMIRQNREEKYKSTFGAHLNTKPSLVESRVPEMGPLMDEFKQAESYLKHVSNKVDRIEKDKTHTLKNYHSNVGETQSLLFHPATIVPELEQVSTELPTSFASAMALRPKNPLILPAPKYGIMKGGLLPTVRSSLNRTQSNHGQPIDQSMTQPNHAQSILQHSQSTALTGEQNTSAFIQQQKINESLKKMSELKQTMSKIKLMNEHAHKALPKKQRRTLRRTYKVGKSKVFPRVSVLVSNKTIRSNISTKTQLIKQHPIEDVKKYLMKHGFIKVGSTAPNDVLRKMYESSIMICGEVQNHNPDNLLYNFLYGKEDV